MLLSAIPYNYCAGADHCNSDFYINICSSFSALPLLHFLPYIFVIDSHAHMICTRQEKGKGSWNTEGKILSLNCVNSAIEIFDVILHKWKKRFCISLPEFVKFRGIVSTDWLLSLHCPHNSPESSSAFLQKFSCQFVGKDSLIWIFQSATTAKVKYAEAALTLINIH